MGKSLNGEELGKGIGQRKDGRYEYRRMIAKQKISFYSFDLDEINCFKEYVESQIQNGTDFSVKSGNKLHDKEKEIILDEVTKQKEFRRLKKSLKDKEGYVYFVSNGEYVKIGHAINIEDRMNNLQCGSPYKLKLMKILKSTDYINLETQLHNLFSKYKVLGEWYDILFLFDNDK